MKYKHIVANWLAIHTFALSVILILAIVLPLEGCLKNYNIAPIEKEQEDSKANLIKQKQDKTSGLQDSNSISNPLPTDTIKPLLTEIPVGQLQDHKEITLKSSYEEDAISLSTPDTSTVNKETQSSGQQLMPGSSADNETKESDKPLLEQEYKVAEEKIERRKSEQEKRGIKSEQKELITNRKKCRRKLIRK
jgi:hypothetical protein